MVAPFPRCYITDNDINKLYQIYMCTYKKDINLNVDCLFIIHLKGLGYSFVNIFESVISFFIIISFMIWAYIRHSSFMPDIHLLRKLYLIFALTFYTCIWYWFVIYQFYLSILNQNKCFVCVTLDHFRLNQIWYSSSVNDVKLYDAEKLSYIMISWWRRWRWKVNFIKDIIDHAILERINC